jgi:hypothetical protein
VTTKRSSAEPVRVRGPLTRCDYHDPETGEVCDAVASYGFAPHGYQGVKPHPLEKNTCTLHRPWGQAYWRKLNGKD